jgi:hypothetical protein
MSWRGLGRKRFLPVGIGCSPVSVNGGVGPRVLLTKSSVSGTNQPQLRPFDVLSTYSLSPRRFPHVVTTSSISGRAMGFWCQHPWRNSRILRVRCTSPVFCGNPGRPPLSIWIAAAGLPSGPKGGLPVKTSIDNMAKAKMSAGMDSTTIQSMPGGGFMISGASHLAFPAVHPVAVNVMAEVMGANP